MNNDWNAQLRDIFSRQKQAMELYRNQEQAAKMNAQNNGTTNFTAVDTGGIINPGSFTPAPAGMNASQFSGAPLESASFYGSGQMNEVGYAPSGDESSPFLPPPSRGRWQMGDDGRMVDPNTGQHRILSQRDGSTRAKPRLMGSAGGGGLNKFQQQQRRM